MTIFHYIDQILLEPIFLAMLAYHMCSITTFHYSSHNIVQNDIVIITNKYGCSLKSVSLMFSTVQASMYLPFMISADYMLFKYRIRSRKAMAIRWRDYDG